MTFLYFNVLIICCYIFLYLLFLPLASLQTRMSLDCLPVCAGSPPSPSTSQQQILSYLWAWLAGQPECFSFFPFIFWRSALTAASSGFRRHANKRPAVGMFFRCSSKFLFFRSSFWMQASRLGISGFFVHPSKRIDSENP